MTFLKSATLHGIAAAFAALTAIGTANAALTINGSVGGAPIGVTLDNLNALPLGSAGGVTSTGIIVSFQPDAAAVQGSVGGIYAAPFLSGNNGNGFGSPNQPNGADTTTFLTSGSTGSMANAAVTLVLPALQQYFGLLWGSVDDYNTLSFFNGNTLVGSVTGNDVTGSPNGNQGVGGTLYVNINSTLAFNRVVATSTQFAFEFDNVAYNATAVPEPASIALLGTALLGFASLARRRRRRA